MAAPRRPSSRLPLGVTRPPMPAVYGLVAVALYVENGAPDVTVPENAKP